MKTPYNIINFLCYFDKPIFKKIAGNLVIISLIFSQNFAYASQNLPITPDGSTNTSVTNAGNGVPVVNIAAPNSGGLSHNKYTNYNVNQQGLILNNATGNANGVVSTQIGGLILDNPNLTNRRAASVILNEVTSTNKTYINGYTEIAGKQAELIIANPNGISVNGGGFINTSRLTMVVGSSNQHNPHIDDLKFFLSNQPDASGFLPSLTISGSGIDLEQVQESDLVANVMNIVAPIYGGNNSVNLRAGDNQFSYSDKSTTSHEGLHSNPNNSVAIDASALGKVQAGTIFIIATKEGFGVKYSSDMIANRGGVTIDSKGNIDYNNIATTGGNINITSRLGSITTHDVTYNSSNNGTINLLAANDITLNSQLISNNDISIHTNSNFTNNAIDVNIAANNFTIHSNNLSNNGSLIANNLNIHSGSLTENNGNITAENILTINTLNMDNNSGILEGSNGIELSVNSNQYNITGSIISSGYLNISANNIINDTNLSANTDITINANGDFTNGTLDENNENLNNDILIAANDNVTIIAQNDIRNYGTISASNNLVLESTNGNISNNKYAEIIGGTGELQLNALNGMVNQFSDNSLVSHGDLTLNVEDFVNTGRVDIAGDFTLNVENDLTNEEGALIYSGNDMTLNVGNNLTNNKDATIYAENNLTIQKYGVDDERYDVDNNRINQLDNISADIISYNGNMTILSDTINNKKANKRQQGPETLTRTNHYQVSHGVHYNFYYTSNVTGTDSKAAQINSGGSLVIDSQKFVNDASNIFSQGDLTLNVSNTFDNLTHNVRQYTRHVHCQVVGCWTASYSYPDKGESYTANIKSGGNINGTIAQYINNNTIKERTSPDISKQQTPNIVNNVNVNNLLENGIVDNDLSYYIDGPDYQGMFQKSDNPHGPLFETRSQFVDQSKFFGSDYFYEQIGVDLAELEEDFQQQNQRLVGDQFFQAKIIREQLSTLKKNTLLLSDSNTNHNAEVKTLLDNAATEYTRLGLTQNQPLSQSQIDNLEKDIVWFETSQIDGQIYIVPKVYLSKTTRENLKNNDSLTSKSTIFAKNNINIETQGAITNHGSIVGNNVELSAAHNIENTNFSDITATDSLTLTSSEGSIINRSELKSGGDLTINAADNVYNLATVETNAQNLLDENNNHTDTQIYRQNNSGATNSGNIRSELIETASISGKNVTINAAKDVNNLAANIESTGNLAIKAGDDVNISTLQLRDRTVTHWGTKKKGGVSVTDTTTNVSSNVNSSGSINVTAGTEESGDINIIGSTINSTNNITLSAQNDVNIEAAQDTYFSESSSWKKGTTVSKNSFSTKQTITHVKSELSSDGDISITSNADINLIGTSLSAVNADLTAGNEINIYSVADQEYSYSTSSKSRSFANITKYVSPLLSVVHDFYSVVPVPVLGNITAYANSLANGNISSHSTLSEKQSVKNQASNISLSRNLTINSNADLNIAGSKLDGSTANISSTNGNINIYNVKDYDYSRSESNKSSTTLSSVATGFIQVGASSMSSLMTTYDTLKTPDQKYDKLKENQTQSSNIPQKQRINQRENMDETIVASELTFANLTINSAKNTNITSSDLTTTSGDLNIVSGTSASGSTNILTDTENDYSYSYDVKKSPKVAAAFSNSIAKIYSDAIPRITSSKSDGTQSNNDINELVYDKESTRITTNTSTNVASNLVSAADINISSQDNNLVSGSTLEANNINLEAINGTTTITSAQDTSST
ncbi:MAG: filamentous hemagglutinin N-terminal domain-containing protein, partial [Rickettsiales bacterium]|nr:filamentous hemagglutinin N-terminal domain-containing protein [Rickettsiales bacterium]